MEKSQILNYWLDFFRDLLLGTLKNLFLFGFIGLGLGVSTIIIFDSQVLDGVDWSNWIKTLTLFMVSIWYLGFGVLHGWIACVLKEMIQSGKIKQITIFKTVWSNNAEIVLYGFLPNNKWNKSTFKNLGQWSLIWACRSLIFAWARYFHVFPKDKYEDKSALAV